MTPVLLHPGLSHKLLVAISIAHADGSAPAWLDCATIAGVRASPQAINRAISHLAEAGLVEGLMTADGWTYLRPTRQGLARAGRRIQHDWSDDDPSPPIKQVVHRSNADRLSAAMEEVSGEVRVISRYAGVTWLRTREAVSPRLSAVRASVADTWHMFTTFP